VTGNGQATAILFAREGASVLCVDAVEERAQATVDMIRKEGGTASASRADVSKAGECKAMVAVAMERYGRLDILDNNVGISVRADVLEVTEAQWDRVMAVNVKSIVFTAKYAIPQMIKGGGGSIINISSIAGLRANQSTPYSTSKAAVIGITRSMAGDHGRQGIRVNCIVPGLIYGPMVAGRMDAALRETRRNAAPLGTEGNGWDIGWAAVFLASDEARWITGVALPVDAGFLVMSPTTNARLAQQKL
jgi:NAD(P)-dependent dehydrogenase (short-subunit alcohol dehydrogenase family)